jgi:diguanylate cyclase (GGDEF)-like protein/PAS domain S-box-containing protein
MTLFSFSAFSLSLALWQSPFVDFLKNPVTFLMPRLQALHWPALLIGGVLCVVIWLLLKKFVGAWMAARKRKPNAFPGDENSLRGVFEDSAAGFALIDRDGKVLHANRALQKLLGYELDQLLGQALAVWAHPEDARADKTAFGELLEGQRARYCVERRFYDATGRVLWLREEVFAPRSLNFQAQTPGTRAVVMIEDITRGKVAEEELHVTREAIHNLYQVIVGRHLDLLEKIQALLKMGCRRFNVETGVLGEMVEGGFEILQIVSPDERIRRGKTYERSVEMGDWPEPVFARGQRLSESESTRAARDWRRFPFYGIADVEVFLSVPVFANGEPFGALCFSSVTARVEEFSDAEKEFLQLMAQWLGSELERLQVLAELEDKQQALMKANTQLEALASVDGLTGVKNRRALEEHLEMELRRAQRYKSPLSFLMLDVDQFKGYNDAFGHPAGDEVLRKVAQVLGNNVRVIDFVARYGGEEFAVLLPQTDASGAHIVAERLRTKIQDVLWPHRGVTASFGIGTLTENMKERADLIAAADRALYASKEAGRNRSTHAQDATETVIEKA